MCLWCILLSLEVGYVGYQDTNNKKAQESWHCEKIIYLVNVFNLVTSNENIFSKVAQNKNVLTDGPPIHIIMWNNNP